MPSRKKTIIIVCPYPLDTAPSQRLHYEQYLNFLKSNGYSFYIFSFFSRRHYFFLYKKGFIFRKALAVLSGFINRIALAFCIPFVDGIYIHLNVTPIGPPLLERLYLFLSRKAIYDINDMVFMNKTSHSNGISRHLKDPRRYFVLLKDAAHVITCTPFLLEIAKKYNKSVTNIFTTIDTHIFVPRLIVESDTPLVIGWSGSHSTAPYLHLIDEVLRRLAGKYDFLLLVMGVDYFEIPGVKTEAIPWSPRAELESFQRMDIGLYPLPNDEWVKGKGGGKALQYMAHALPTVASAAGCNSELMENNRSGLLAGNEKEWYDCIESLMLSPDLRKKIGIEARRRVEKLYSVDANKSTYLSIFQCVYGRVP